MLKWCRLTSSSVVNYAPVQTPTIKTSSCKKRERGGERGGERTSAELNFEVKVTHLLL